MVSWSGGETNRDYSDGRATMEMANLKAGEPVRFTARTYLSAFLKVTNSAGEPVADANIRFQEYDVFSSDQSNKMYSLRTGKDGSVQLERMADGAVLNFTVSSNSNYRERQFSVPVSRLEYTAVLHRPNEPAEHEVLVMEPSGKPIPNCPLMLFTRVNNEYEHEEVRTDASGRYVMPKAATNQDAAVICDHPEFGLAMGSIQSYQEGVLRLYPRNAKTPRTIRIVNGEDKPLVGIKVRLTQLADRLQGESMSIQHNSLPSRIPDDLKA